MDVDWAGLFSFTLSPIELFVRGTLIFWFIFMLLRIAGRREFGSVGTANVLLLVMIADAAQNGMAAEYKTVAEGMVLIATLIFWSVFIDRLCFFVPAVRVVLEPNRISLIRDGQMDRRGMRKEYITEEELMAQLRAHGINDVSRVRRAYIEEAGQVTVLPYKN